jgi:hypothetical protein
MVAKGPSVVPAERQRRGRWSRKRCIGGTWMVEGIMKNEKLSRQGGQG